MDGAEACCKGGKKRRQSLPEGHTILEGYAAPELSYPHPKKPQSHEAHRQTSQASQERPPGYSA